MLTTNHVKISPNHANTICYGYYIDYVNQTMKIRLCGKCGIMWSRESRLIQTLECPNCSFENSKEIEIRE